MTARKQSPVASEETVHRAVVRHLDLRGVRGLVYFHPPNGGARSRAEAGRFRAMGVKAGVPDLILLRQGQAYALELKAERGRPSPAQRDMAARMQSAGAVVAVAYGLDEALAQLESWGLLVPDASVRFAPLHTRTAA